MNMYLMDSHKETVSVEKSWLKSYPPGVPENINPDAYQSIVEVFEHTCQQYRNLPAFYSMGVTISFNHLDKHSRNFAAYLQQDIGLKKGDRVAIMLPNVLQYPVALFGALRAGLVVVNVNPLYTADELRDQVNNAGAETIIALENFANTVEKALPEMPGVKHIIITQFGDLFPTIKSILTHIALKYFYKKIPNWHIPSVIMFKQALAQGRKQVLSPVTLNNQDIAFLQYTGGTTGISKGAILTHRNIIANIQQASTWVQSATTPGKEIMITALPLYHIFSLLANCLFFFSIGGLNVLIANPRDIPSMIKDMKKFKFTAITGVNTLFNALLKNPDFAKLDFSKLHFSLGGGMSVHASVAEKWQLVTHAPLLEAYGLTETSPCVTINPPNLTSYNGSIGLPVSSTLVTVLDDNGQPVPVGQAGELAIKGPQVMKGYWHNPAETDKVFTKDGWLLTGDIGCMDEKGFFRILERKKDMILVSGFNVYPNEIESVLAKLPGVAEVAVVGVADENSGETVKAFIVRDRDNSTLTADDVIQYTRQHLTAYKVPKYVEFCTDLPKSNVGKILRRELRR